jgi:regulator of sigma D
MTFRGFFQSRTSESSLPPSQSALRAPGTSIGYDPLLIKRLQSDQQRLLELFTQAQSLLTNSDYNGVRRKLAELRITLQDHLMTSSVKFYIYISRQVASDPAKAALVNSHRREMIENSRRLIDFFRTYSTAPLDDGNASLFQTELLVIGAALVQRIEREQTSLFPLYKASY